MDRAIRESMRRDEPLQTGLELRRAGRVAEALDAFEAVWAAGRADAGQAEDLLCAGLDAVPAGERLAHGVRLERLLVAGLEGAAVRWPLWFPAAARLVGWSEPMRRVRAFLYAHARAAEPVVLRGESGVGHGLVVRTLHALSGRSGYHEAYAPQSHVRLLAEVEAQPAPGGTLYLSYANEADATVGRVIEACARRGVRLVVGLVGGGQSALASGPAALAGLPSCTIAPLRERLADLPLLVSELLTRAGAAEVAASLEQPVFEMLAWPTWPGNVRELANHVSRAVLASREPDEIPELLVQTLFGLPGEVSEEMA